jgi:hypothetical protein
MALPGGFSLAAAIRYALTRWQALCRFLGDGRIELDTNAVERAIRPVALGRKTICSPDPTAARIDGPSSSRFSRRRSSTTSSLSRTSRMCSSAHDERPPNAAPQVTPLVT